MKLDEMNKLTPAEFERLVGMVVKALGYDIRHIEIGEDIGIDILAAKDQENMAIQVKKYMTRKINLSMIYHTYGAAAYYDCNQAVIVTLSELTPRAIEAANKLKVEIWDRYKLIDLIESHQLDMKLIKNPHESYRRGDWFYQIWDTHIKELQGKKIKHLSRDTYIMIIQVNDDGITYINSNGRKRNLDVDIFQQVLTKFRSEGFITREKINDNYQRRGSSAISAILAALPNVYIDHSRQPRRLVWRG